MISSGERRRRSRPDASPSLSRESEERGGEEEEEEDKYSSRLEHMSAGTSEGMSSEEENVEEERERESNGGALRGGDLCDRREETDDLELDEEEYEDMEEEYEEEEEEEEVLGVEETIEQHFRRVGGQETSKGKTVLQQSGARANGGNQTSGMALALAMARAHHQPSCLIHECCQREQLKNASGGGGRKVVERGGEKEKENENKNSSKRPGAEKATNTRECSREPAGKKLSSHSGTENEEEEETMNGSRKRGRVSNSTSETPKASNSGFASSGRSSHLDAVVERKLRKKNYKSRGGGLSTSAAAKEEDDKETDDLDDKSAKDGDGGVVAAACTAEEIAGVLDILRQELRGDSNLNNEENVTTTTATDNSKTGGMRGGGRRIPGEDMASAFHFTRKSKKAVYALASVAKHEESTGHIVDKGGIGVLIEVIRRCVNTKNVSVSRAHNLRMLQGYEDGAVSKDEKRKSKSSSIHKTAEYILKNSCLVVGFVAMNGQYRKQVIEQGGVGVLVNVLRCYSALCVQNQKGSGSLFLLQHKKLMHALKKEFEEGATTTPPSYTIARRAAGALANLAHEDVRTKNLVREEGGIPALVLLLKARESSVQISAASTLKAIAFRNEDNKNQIVECGALGSLVCMLRSSDPSIHYEAVAVMSGLVHSSAHIKKLVLNGGALQPLINLLSSSDMESRREAALLLGQFANVQDPDYKTKIVQRGALGPLISMLSEESVQVSEMAAFAIGRLAQNVDNQAGIVQAGGLQPLVQLLKSKHLNSQHNAAFALYGLSDNDDNVPHFLKSGCVSLLLNGTFHVQASKDCVRNTLRKLEEKIAQNHEVLSHLRGVLSSDSADLTGKYYIATGLAYLAPRGALRSIFMENGGMDILLFHALNSDCLSCQKESINALHTLGVKTGSFSKLPTLENGTKPGIYENVNGMFMGIQYLDNPTKADILFQLEGGREIYAHKIALLAASHNISYILLSDSSSTELEKVPIRDVDYDTFLTVLRFVYSGQITLTEGDNVRELLRQSEKLQLDGLKYACETFLMASIDAHSVSSIYDLAVETNTVYLQKAAVWYAISEYSRLVLVHGAVDYTKMLSKMSSCMDMLTI